jgi:hypothetical protein
MGSTMRSLSLTRRVARRDLRWSIVCLGAALLGLLLAMAAAG